MDLCSERVVKSHILRHALVGKVETVDDLSFQFALYLSIL